MTELSIKNLFDKKKGKNVRNFVFLMLSAFKLQQ